MINSSGIGRYLQIILPDIIEHFSNVFLLGDEQLLKEKLQNDNLHVIPFNEPIYSISEQLKYPYVIPKCDIFFSPHYNVPLLPIKAKHRIVTIHDVFHLAFHQGLNISQRIYSKAVINQALKKSDAVITVSEFSKEEIVKYTNKKYIDKISVIYNGVRSWGNLSETQVDYCGYKPYFLFVGNVKPHKNLRRTIETYRLLLLNIGYIKQKPYFIIAGKKDGFITGDNITALIENDPLLQQYVKFTGWITDNELQELYSNALALIFPSYYEGFGFPPLEAMSYGTPSIVANAASISEVCGNAVLYFNPFDINDIYDKMKCVFNNLHIRKELIEKGRENIKRFSCSLSIESHIKLFECFFL
ncbi:glycosyltransferase [termite gut metagenome]|uniref:Glycosyltransferase n=1 Tax=termite gut metagenome TaxID=433724 RepID=A0A5J4SAX4_9ZZZZ